MIYGNTCGIWLYHVSLGLFLLNSPVLGITYTHYMCHINVHLSLVHTQKDSRTDTLRDTHVLIQLIIGEWVERSFHPLLGCLHRNHWRSQDQTHKGRNRMKNEIDSGNNDVSPQGHWKRRHRRKHVTEIVMVKIQIGIMNIDKMRKSWEQFFGYETDV